MEGERSAGLALEALAATHAVCRLGPAEQAPEWAVASPGALLSLTRGEEELSIVCAEAAVPAEIDRSGGWRALRVAGTLEHGLTGILVSLAAPLAEAGVPIFAISTFDTDYLLVPGSDLERATEALAAAGHSIDDPGSRADG